MRNTSRLAAILVLTGTTHSLSAAAVEPSAPSPGPSATPGAAAGSAGAAAEPSSSPALTPASAPAAQVPVEDAAGSYAAPGSADSAAGSGSRATAGASSATNRPTPPRPMPTPAVSDADRGAESEPSIPLARDTVGGHLAVGAIAGLAVPFGSADSSVKLSDLAGPGLYLGGDITYGVSRTVMVGAYGEVAMPAGETCPCRPSWSAQSVSAIAAGPLLRYHLVQGPRFDPWMSYGFGFRRISSGKDSFTGVDWARLQLGGDWYPSSRLGLGPVLEMSLGTFFDSRGTLESKAVNAQFTLGLRVVFDSPGK
ncbi:MAG TPA: hypothetical protein VF395_08650 [Polyangiaceae bacterium]